MAHETAKSLGSMAEERSTSHNKLIPMKYSWEEINTRREAGLCIFCDERETPDHHLKHKRLRLVMVDLAYTSLVDREDLKRDSDLKAKVNEVVEIEVKTEVATKSMEKLVHEAFSDDKSTPQFQVPIANSEILESIEPTEVNLGLETLESLAMNENLEQDWVKQNINKRFEVVDDVDRGQKVVSITKICSAHQVFGKMSQHEEKLGIKKKAKGFKSWMFKFKATKGNIRKQDNKGWFHTWRRKMSWRKNKTTKLQFVSQGKLFFIDSFQSSRGFEVSRMVKENMMQVPKLLCQAIDQSRRDVTHVLPLYARSVLKLELQEAVRFSRGQITGFVLEMVDGCEQSTGMKVTYCAHQIFDVRPPMVQQKMKKEKSLKSWKFKFKPEKEDIKQQHNQVFYVSDFRIAMWLFHHEEKLPDHIGEGFKSWSSRMTLGLLFRPNSQEILRGENLEWKMKKLKCPKSWNFKFRYRALRTSKGSLLLLYFSVWHCWKMKFKLCLSRLIDLLQREVLNHSTDHLVIVDKTEDWIGNHMGFSLIMVLRGSVLLNHFALSMQWFVYLQDQHVSINWTKMRVQQRNNLSWTEDTSDVNPKVSSGIEMGFDHHEEKLQVVDGVVVNVLFQHSTGLSIKLQRQTLQDLQKFTIGVVLFLIKHKWRFKFLHSVSAFGVGRYEYSIWKQSDKGTQFLCSRRLVIYKLGSEATSVVEMYQRVYRLVKLKFSKEERKIEVIQSQTFDPGIGLKSQEILRSLFQAQLLQWFLSNGFMTLWRKLHRSCLCFAMTISRLTLWSRFFEEGRFDVGNELQMRRLRGGQ
ncbi:hypothetical protein ISN44_As09g031800 [Arabidopsis suecica]|uniref:Uncharacterized protein n=1 Tax=Arabidopsis suecica TaxID=45249 RepID=A0A8T2AQX8_ARASU|nr:hypothetical protein ISN44_As09g031800 [Arabidopsis suecica]